MKIRMLHDSIAGDISKGEGAVLTKGGSFDVDDRQAYRLVMKESAELVNPADMAKLQAITQGADLGRQES